MIDRKTLKGFLIGVIFSSLIIGGTAFADSIEKNIVVTFDGITTYINGIITTSKDSDGNELEPFKYNGAIYVPLATVQQFNKDAKWDEGSNSVYLGKTDISSPDAWIDDLDCVNFQKSFSLDNNYKKWDKENDKDNTGNQYGHGIEANVYNYLGKGWVQSEYLLNSEYKTVSGKFVLNNTSKNSTLNASLEIYGDDKLLYTSPKMTGGILPIAFKVDVNGVTKIAFKVVHDMDNDNLQHQETYYYGLVNVGFYK